MVIEYDKYGNPTTKWSINERNTPNDFETQDTIQKYIILRLKKVSWIFAKYLIIVL